MSRIAVIYFSATGVTKTIAEVMQQALSAAGAEATLYDVTPYTARQKPLPVEDFDGFLFGFPVYGDFAPSVINDWLPTLAGKGKPCATFFTYGGRTTGYAHFHTKLLLEKAGFRVLFTGEFLGRHSYNVGGWTALPHRPDERDFVVARQFAALALERFAQAAPQPLALQKPFGYNGAAEALPKRQWPSERGPRHPFRFTETCSMCRACEEECPTQAFDADAGLTNPQRCITCFHCIHICPDQALKLADSVKLAYAGFLQGWCLTEAMMDAKQSKIITEFWQAAC